MNSTVVTVDEHGTALLEFNRPDALNALSVGLMRDVRSALAELAADRAVRALVITGRGKGFCAGADLVSVDFAAGL